MADYISAMPIQPPAIARVVVNLSLDREFDYRIPERLRGQVHAGTRVVVPFGHSERVAYVVGLAADSTVHGLKEILRLENEKERIPEKLITLAQWMADYYCCPRELAVRAMLPAVVRMTMLPLPAVLISSPAPERLAMAAPVTAILPLLESRLLARVRVPEA